MKTVYVVGGEAGPRKIGITGDIKARLYNLSFVSKQQLAVLASFDMAGDDARVVEKIAHALLQEKRSNGEWFNVSTEEAIAAITEAMTQIEAAAGVSSDVDDPSDPIIRKSISLRESLWREIEAFQRREATATLAEAVRRLLSEALLAAKRRDK